MCKTALVVGGGQTLGAFLCEGLAADGYRVAVADLNGDNAQQIADKINQISSYCTVTIYSSTISSVYLYSYKR